MAYIHAHTAEIALNLGKREHFPLVSRWAIQVASTIVTWYDRYNTRRPLSTMPYGLLEDIGITPEQARLEAAKPFWRS